jgi:hypothetical protein
VEGFFPRIAKGVLHHFGDPTSEGGRRGKRMGHGKGRESFSMAPPNPKANEN